MTRPVLSDFRYPNADSDAPTFILYTPQSSGRLEYACRFIFNQVLRTSCVITTDLDAYSHSTLFRINYSAIELPDSVQIIPHLLLFETGILHPEPVPVFKNGQIYFFENKTEGPPGSLHFDLFSAVFYFISRYEEWGDYERDQHQRFEAKASLLFRNGFHLKPVVDQWILEFGAILQQRFQTSFVSRPFKIISSIDVDNLFAYRFKGVLRTLGASIKDLAKGDLRNLVQRFKVLSGKAKDPFDIYETVSDFCLAEEIPLIYFFLFRTGTKYDRTVEPGSGAFEPVLTVIKNKKVQTGLHPSYDATFRPGLLEEEVKAFSAVLGEPVSASRQHFLRFDIRIAPKLLLKNGIKEDYSMGFASSPGFRAGTAYPFFYYDFDQEQTSDLLFVPFCAMDGAYLIYDKVSPETTLTSLLDLCSEIKKTGGLFMTIFHERTFSDHLYPGFSPLYKNLHLQAKAL